MLHTIIIFLLFFVSLFMITLILIQRGKGGGLAGAFGGMGGQSAFGTKAGDAFTKITVVTAVLWFALCIGSIICLKHIGAGSRLKGSFGEGLVPEPAATETTGDAPATPAAPVETNP